jgi:hypothetical protein
MNRRMSSDAACHFALCWMLLLSGCATRDMSQDPASVTDYRVGNVYQLKVDAFLLSKTGLLMTMEEAGKRPEAGVEAVVPAGTYFKLRQIVSVRGDEPRTEIYAEIISGPSTGRIVNLRTASLTDSQRGTTRRDPAVMVPFLFSH